MAKGENNKTLEERIAALETEVENVKKRGGGMLSSADFRNRVVHKESKDCDYSQMMQAFLTRDWATVGRRFIIEPYDELNVTPFSYDLSIGNDIFSARKKDRIRRRLPYDVTPGETVIVLTREFIALPPCYSATVWPRFKLVREGIFQSMVKIDPTWYGKLGVAMTNFSSRTITLVEGLAFGTLILYELSSESDLNLWRPEELQTIKVSIPNIPLRNTLHSELGKLGLSNICWVQDNSLFVRGLKKSSYEELRKIDGSKPWLDTVEEAKKKWIESVDQKNKKSIGMEALGMEDLEKLTSGSPMGKWLDQDIIEAQEVTDKELYGIAIEYGRPFDFFANIPKLIKDTIEKEVTPKISAEVEAKLFPQVVQLTIRVIALLSLIGVAAALAGQYFQKEVTWIGVVALIVIPVMYAFLIWQLRNFPAGKSGAKKK
jgi:deoxycytidine triphosphate deaminase